MWRKVLLRAQSMQMELATATTVKSFLIVKVDEFVEINIEPSSFMSRSRILSAAS
ncbi:hypothetical protein PGT21_020043 [Puccinia graminis f. sp. tritici]|uniref:Uncharacterized protein n=2 Tax=Puccinia graminis f. sp. tritici TaxID=56615 RepID=E3KBW0_PUCGT|nr:uncharacterized protein PGTG_08221 [Puccinia graminis f. sp. tritici CRL 75-36-700-3]EFP81972.1 hypothetical protein PGTG_08221 [Puccinia graminis f. sp. tritici CRL 75-36-700-3]KAA1117693.1 hypothetical protein PGT21_020043 [Puccinia graminis f. sp. tritici]KAA1138080.1 hypothetical protein PGTUg99_029041 [Puccinia graminis f. sp. tritici]